MRCAVGEHLGDAGYMAGNVCFRAKTYIYDPPYLNGCFASATVVSGDHYMSDRIDDQAAAWPLRPWILATICSVAGLAFHFLTHHHYDTPLAPWRQAGATFVAIGTLSFVISVERRRWIWSAAFATGWGLIIALVGWFTAQYNAAATIFEWPYWSGLLAVMIAAPLFQTMRDEGRRSLPYAKLHGHAWADAVIGASSLAFTGIVFLLAWLISGLFDLIGIEQIRKLLEKDWFNWMLAGLAFGTAVGILSERDRLLPMLQRLVRIVLGVLAPPLAVALVLFLASIPFTGLEKFWKSGVPATPLLLTAGAGAILLANTVFAEDAESRSANAVLRWASLALVAVVLPLAAIAALSLGIRVNQYGWSPERMWGVVAVAIATIYGFAGSYAIWRGRKDFDEPLRPMQTVLAIGLCSLALFLALPIIDFGAISASSQLARLRDGKVSAAKFDWAAMAFDFGPAGRHHLEQIARSGPIDSRRLAQAALTAKNRYATDTVVESAENDRTLNTRLRILSPDIQLTAPLRRHLTAAYDGCDDQPCILMRIDDQRLLLISKRGPKAPVEASIIGLKDLAKENNEGLSPLARNDVPSASGVDLTKAKVEIRTVQLRQAFVDGKAVGEPF